MSKSNSKGHLKRNKSSRYRAKLKAKHKRVRVRRSRGQRSTYR